MTEQTTVVIPPQQVEQIQRIIRQDNPQGYALFYLLIRDMPPPLHVMAWVRFIYASLKEKKTNAIIEAFRGSTKTTAVTQAFVAYRIGNYPAKTCLLIQSGDSAARDNTTQIAHLIEHNPAWKLCFPNIVPDKERGWGDEGYFVKDTSVDYGEWVRHLEKDPTFVGYGYTSSSIIGKHPSNLLIVDDILNEENTRSAREIDHAKQVYSGTILPTRSPGHPLNILIGTPWTDSDVLAANKATGVFAMQQTKVYRDDGRTPTWPEGMDEEKIDEARRLDVTGGVQFARMYLLDLTAAARRIFQYHSYPSHLIDTSWPVVGGVDYAGVYDPTKRNPSQSHFALAYVMKLPGGGAVVFGGVLEQCSQGESEEHVKRAHAMFPNWLEAIVEGDGKGEDFLQVLMRNPALKLFPMKTGGKSKAQRLVGQMGPWLRSARVRISDGESFFLFKLRDFLNKYPNVDDHHPGWDAADAVYWALRGMPDVLQMDVDRGELPSSNPIKRKNPFSSLGQQHA